MTITNIKPIIVRVGDSKQVDDHFFQSSKQFNFTPIILNDLPALFTRLNRKNFLPKAIILDLSTLCTVTGSNVFEIISTIHTLINAKNIGQIKSDPPVILAAMVEKDSPLEFIRGVQSTDIKVFIPKSDWTQNGDSELALKALLDNQSFMPKKLQEQLKSTTKTRSKKSQSSDGGIQLTVRQEQVLELIRDRGASNKVIANMLKISESTVKLHITAVLRKYGARNRTQLALFSNRQKDSQ